MSRAFSAAFCDAPFSWGALPQAVDECRAFGAKHRPAGTGQDAAASAELRTCASFALDYRQLSRDHIVRAVAVRTPTCPLRLKKNAA